MGGEWNPASSPVGQNPRSRGVGITVALDLGREPALPSSALWGAFLKIFQVLHGYCLLYTSDAADDWLVV